MSFINRDKHRNVSDYYVTPTSEINTFLDARGEDVNSTRHNFLAEKVTMKRYFRLFLE